MKECSACQHDIQVAADFGSILNHELYCPARRGADRADIEKYNAGYMDRLGDRYAIQQVAVYDLGWQQADRYLARQVLQKKFKST